MKRLFLIVSGLFLVLIVTPVSAANAHSPYASRDEAHATLRFNGGLKTHGLISLYLFRVNGKQTLKKGIQVVHLKPGKYELEFRAPGIRNRGHVPDSPNVIHGTSAWQKTDDTVDVVLKPGEVYYIAGKPHGNGAWTAIVWKTESRDKK
jgi:hypothetical protein